MNFGQHPFIFACDSIDALDAAFSHPELIVPNDFLLLKLSFPLNEPPDRFLEYFKYLIAHPKVNLDYRVIITEFSKHKLNFNFCFIFIGKWKKFSPSSY